MRLNEKKVEELLRSVVSDVINARRCSSTEINLNRQYLARIEGKVQTLIDLIDF